MSGQRDGLTILQELLQVTRKMVEQREDIDFLIESVDTRQALMDEFDRLREADPGITRILDQVEVQNILKELRFLDQRISSVMNKHQAEVKEKLISSNKQQRIMGYASNAISSAGSYMDFKK